MPSGFVALNADKVTWAEAKIFCEQNNGKLPRIQNSEAMSWSDRRDVKHIDGFTAPDAKWPAGLRNAEYWTATFDTRSAGDVWTVKGTGGYVTLETARQTVKRCVICVAK